jgi:hypothetical protein
MGAAFHPMQRCSPPIRAVKSDGLLTEWWLGKSRFSALADLTARLRQAEVLDRAEGSRWSGSLLRRNWRALEAAE